MTGVHSPECDFEHDPVNVQAAIRRLHVTYPRLDNAGMPVCLRVLHFPRPPHPAAPLHRRPRSAR